MHYTNRYHSPFGTILLAADDTGLTGLWFEDQKYFAQGLDKETEEKERNRRKRVLNISNGPPLAGCLFLRTKA